MRIYVFRDSVFAHIVPRATSQSDILYIPVPLDTPIEHLESVLGTVPIDIRRQAEEVVFRVHPKDFDSYLTALDVAADTLVHRAEHRTLRILTWRDGAHLSFDLRSRVSTPLTADDQHLREAEMWSLLQSRGALLQPNEDFHYQGPNGFHYKGFVRVGLALTTTENMDAMLFWLLPALADADTILVDNGYMLGLAMRAAHYARSTGLAIASKVEAITEYGEREDLIAQRLAPLANGSDGLLLLMSVKSSGQLLAKLEMLAGRYWPDRVRTASLYAVHGSADGESLCVLPAEYSKVAHRDCAICRSGTPLVRIDRTTYLLELSALPVRKQIRVVDADATRTFFERYKGGGVARLHSTRGGPHEIVRHQMIYFDVDRLLELNHFRERLGDCVEKYKATNAVLLSPTHPAAAKLTALVAERTSLSAVYCDEDELSNLAHETLSTLRNAERLIIIDDVITTGSRLRNYKNRLRHADILTERTKIDLLVGVARPTSRETLRSLQDILLPGGALIAVETLVVPNWDEKLCPWCAERDFLTEAFSRRGLDDFLARRLSRLNDPADGLTEDIFLRWHDGFTRMELGPQSVFGSGLSAVELFVCVASAIQNLRSQRELTEEFQPPVARVLSPDGYLTGRYYEPIIDACICRATKRHDLRTANIENELIEKLGRRFSEVNSESLWPELLFAISRDRLPRPVSIDALYDERLDSDLRAIFQELLDPA